MADMNRRDSHKRFGLIGLVMIIIAYIAWAFVLPNFSGQDEPLPDGLTGQSERRQAPPTLPASEPPRPTPPTE
jgi:hypothetical protein